MLNRNLTSIIISIYQLVFFFLIQQNNDKLSDQCLMKCTSIKKSNSCAF